MKRLKRLVKLMGKVLRQMTYSTACVGVVGIMCEALELPPRCRSALCSRLLRPEKAKFVIRVRRADPAGEVPGLPGPRPARPFRFPRAIFWPQGRVGAGVVRRRVVLWVAGPHQVGRHRAVLAVGTTARLSWLPDERA